MRRECEVPWRIYRPAMVVGDSQTGEIDKIDGIVDRNIILRSEIESQVQRVDGLRAKAGESPVVRRLKAEGKLACLVVLQSGIGGDCNGKDLLGGLLGDLLDVHTAGC